MRVSLLLLLVALAVTAAVVLLLSDPQDAGLGDASEILDPQGGTAPGPRAPGFAEPPTPRTHPRVDVLAPGEPLPPPGSRSEAEQEVLHALHFESAERQLTGADVVREIGKWIYVRARSRAALEALEALDVDPTWGEGPVPLNVVVEHWRGQGFIVDHAGHALIVARPE